jgi:glycosyltransferase involved in cell wall biosynthesis
MGVNKNILFISYDGMTDPLGQSQVLPYLVGLTQKGYKFTLLSCEKPERYQQHKAVIEEIVNQHNIDWQPISFTASPPVLAKYYDLYRLKQKAFALHKQKNFAMVHCRSYVSAAIGIQLKQKFGVKFLFDMRGFWVDERVDGGAWNLKNPLFKLAYKNYKKKEANYIKAADAMVSLTEAGKKEIATWKSYAGSFIQVIPCSADFKVFGLVDPEMKAASRKLLGLSDKGLVISYLGSVGAWYLLDEMLEFFVLLKKQYPEAKFLFVTPEPESLIHSEGRKYGLEASDFVVKSATRKEVPKFIAASDINIFFIKQSYSKIASSPTKLGEILAMGIPVICNSRIGDVEAIVKSTDAGVAVDRFDKETFQEVISQIPALLAKNGIEIREKAYDYYTLDNAVNKYAEVYQQVLG